MKEGRVLQHCVKDDILIIYPTRNLPSFNTPEVHQEWEQIVALVRSPEIRHVIWNLAEVPYIGSAMVEAMTMCWKAIRNENGKLAICHASTIALDILTLSRFDLVWLICSSQETAIQELRSAE